MKKTLLIFLLFLFFVLPAFSAPFSLANLATGNIKEYDKPLIEGIDYFAGSLLGFLNVAMTLAAGLGFIGIAWCSFKMIFGTEHAKKAVLDIMFKFLLFTFVMALYPKIIWGMLDTAISMGMYVNGGIDIVNKEFTSFRNQMEAKTNLAKNEMERILKYMAQDPNVKQIAPDVLEKMADRFARNEDEKKEWISRQKEGLGSKLVPEDEYEAWKKRNSNIDKIGGAAYFGAGATGPFAPFFFVAGGGTLLWNKFINKNQYYTDEYQVAKGVDSGNYKRLRDGVGTNEGWNSPAVQHAVISLRAMDEIFYPNPDYQPKADEYAKRYGGKAYSSTSAVGKYLFNPFMLNKDGTQSRLLSPSGLIKIGVVITDIINYQTYNTFDEEGNLVPKVTRKDEKGNELGFFTNTLAGIQEFIMSIFFTLGMMLACVFFVIQYCMCIFEYFIITAVGIIFVPCILWDGTKSFAAKLVNLFLAYFFKLMLMVFCLFWVYGFFIKMGFYVMGNQPVLSLLNFSYFLFTVLLGWVVTQNGPKLATTLLNGTPDLSMGEFLHAAGTAALTAKRAAGTTMGAAAIAGKGVQGVNRTVAGTAGVISGVSKAGGGFKDVVAIGLHNLGNAAKAKLTGVKDMGDKGSIGHGALGKDATGANNRMTYGNVEEKAGDYTKARQKKKAARQEKKATTQEQSGSQPNTTQDNSVAGSKSTLNANGTRESERSG